jgi:hypothetical protein
MRLPLRRSIQNREFYYTSSHRGHLPACRRQPRALKLQRWRKALAAGDQ